MGDSRGSDRWKVTSGPALAVQLNVILRLNKLNNSSKSVSSSDFWGKKSDDMQLKAEFVFN